MDKEGGKNTLLTTGAPRSQLPTVVVVRRPVSGHLEVANGLEAKKSVAAAAGREGGVELGAHKKEGGRSCREIKRKDEIVEMAFMANWRLEERTQSGGKKERKKKEKET